VLGSCPATALLRCKGETNIRPPFHLSFEEQSSTSRFAALVQGLATRFGITRALVYSVLGRTWSVLAGPVTLIFIGRFLSREEQGFYYTFWSVLGVWVFFDLGLGMVIVQFASHERAALRLVDGRMTGDERARARLASLFQLAVRWYGFAGGCMLVVVMPAGILFFTRYRAAGAHVVWLLPWILLAITSTINMLIGPLASILEGSGLFHDMALMRLLGAVTGNAMLWIALVSDADLYAAVVLNGATGLFNVIWLYSRHRRFFHDLLTVRAEERISWREEIWPFQWRFAVSWMTGYFMFQIFNPILFATAGPVAAGQMGMSLMVTTAIALFAQAWITTRSVDYGALVASRDFARLDGIFKATLLHSSVVILALAGGFLGAIEVLRRLRHPLAARVLPPLPLVLLLAATLLNHVVNTEASYLRAYKREPFLVIFAPMCAVTTVGSLLVARSYGVTGMLTILLAAVGVIGVGGGSILFRSKRREWREEEPLDPAAAEEMLQP